MDISNYSITSYLNQMTENTKSTSRAASTQSDLDGISSSSTREELTEAAKSFEAYFVEQMLKQQQEILKSINDDDDSTMSQYTDMYMDTTMQSLAETMVEQYGGRFTETMVDQMMRNYGITEDEETVSGTQVSEEA